MNHRSSLFDTHTHLQFKAFKNNLDQVIKDAKNAGIQYINIVGTDLESSKKAIEIAEKYDGIFATIGIHPHHIFSYLTSDVIPARFAARRAKAGIQETEKTWILGTQVRNDNLKKDLEKLEELISEKKVIAVGETGMDRHIYEKTKYAKYQVPNKFIELQKKAFEKQIVLALKFQKSLIIHNREAVDDLLQILALHPGGASTVFHCAQPDQKLLDFAIKNKIYIGIDGDVTYDKAKQEFIKKIPLNLLVLETDSPFLTPKGFKNPNTPANLNYVLEFIADILKIQKEKLAEITFKNSKILFNL